MVQQTDEPKRPRLAVVDASKHETWQLNDTYKTVHRKLLADQWTVEINHNEISAETLRNASMFVVPGPRSPLADRECDHIRTFLAAGGSLFVLLGEGGPAEFGTNINSLLADFQMAFNDDRLVRTQYYKFLHPKECSIGGGIVCEPIWRELLALPDASRLPFAFGSERDRLEFVYPFGATLHVGSPAQVLVNSGPVAYPFRKPLVGYNRTPDGCGRVLCVGSGEMFADRYMTEPTNGRLFEYFVRMLAADRQFAALDFDTDAVAGTATSKDDHLVPDTIHLADQPKMCLLESSECDIPADFKRMFDMRLHAIDNRRVPAATAMYERLGLECEPLRIIKPQFEIPLPALQLAVFPPVFSEHPGPPLELFDLDDAFSSERSQIGQLTAKCLQIAAASPKPKGSENTELAYFVQECGRILGVGGDSRSGTAAPKDRRQHQAKDVLYEIGVKIAKYKKLDRE